MDSSLELIADDVRRAVSSNGSARPRQLRGPSSRAPRWSSACRPELSLSVPSWHSPASRVVAAMITGTLWQPDLTQQATSGERRENRSVTGTGGSLEIAPDRRLNGRIAAMRPECVQFPGRLQRVSRGALAHRSRAR